MLNRVSIGMRINWAFKRYILFILIILLVIPLVLSLFIHAVDYQFKLRTVFLLQRFYITFSALVLILLIVAYRKIKDYKPARINIKQVIIFSALSIIFFALAFSTQIDYDQILSGGVGVDNRVNFDSSRWLALRILSDLDVIADKSNILSDDSDKLRREVVLEELPGKAEAEIVWNGYWQDANNNGVLDEGCVVSLEVNNNAFNITTQYAGLKPNAKPSANPDANTNAKGWMSIIIDKNYLMQGKNSLIIFKRCADAIAITSQTTYINRQTSELRQFKWSYPPFDELVLFVKQDNGFLFNIIFKFGFILRALAVVCLFIAIFGLDFLELLFKKAKWEMVFSFVYSIFMYWFATFIRGYWLFLSKLVAYSDYALMKISFLQPVVSFSDPNLPFLGVPGFMLGIADTCSGIESLGYFVLAYSALVLINWNHINFKKALLLFIPGLIGTFLVNILRVYLLFIIGIFISRDFALNAYHTNAGMVLFILYFIMFWSLAMNIIKREDVQKEDLENEKQIKKEFQTEKEITSKQCRNQARTKKQ